MFERLAGGPLPLWKRLEAEIVERRIDAGGTIFMQDVAHPFVYVVRSGLIKNVYFGEDGEDWIKSFSEEERFFAVSQRWRRRSHQLCGDRRRAERGRAHSVRRAGAARGGRRDMGQRHAAGAADLRGRKEKRERELLTLRPEQRYRAFIAETPGLEQRIPQRDLARHLGLTPVGLNRIVQRVRRG